MEKQFRVRRSFCARGLQSCFAACAFLMVLGCLTDGARAGILTIDDFTQPGSATFFALGMGNNPSKTISQTVTGAIGGQRDLLINVLGQGKANSATGLIGHDTDFGVNALQLQTNGLAPSMTTLQYSGLESLSPSSLINAHALNAGLGVDLTSGGTNNRFLIEFLYCDATPTSGLDLTITITSPGGKSSTTAMEIAPNAQSTYNFFVPFGALVGNASPSNADSITYVFNGRHTPNADYVVQLLGTTSVPEPASGTLLLTACGILGLAAYAARRRRRRPLPAETG